MSDDTDVSQITKNSTSGEDEEAYKKLKKQKDLLLLQHAIVSSEKNLTQLQNTLLVKEIGNLETVEDFKNSKKNMHTC